VRSKDAQGLIKWWHGARPRTWGAAFAPVITGSAIAAHLGSFQFGLACLALVVALAMQIGVNYANDYSDGIRGTDASRVGPVRLVGQGLASPHEVKRAAWLAFLVGAVAGLILCLWSGQLWLIGVGALAIAAAWFYTGGSRPYGYLGLGEVVAFIFFGPVAVIGTSYTQSGQISSIEIWAGAAIGAFAAALVLVNNIRDITTDRESQKRTIAVLLGERNSRFVYATLLIFSFVCLLPIASRVGGSTWWAGLAALPAGFALREVTATFEREPATARVGRTGRPSRLIRALTLTSASEMVYAIGLAIALVFGLTILN